MATTEDKAGELDAGVSYLFQKDLRTALAAHQARRGAPLAATFPPHLLYLEDEASRFDWIASLPKTRFYVVAHGSKDGCFQRAVPATPDGKYEVMKVEDLVKAIKGHADYDQQADVILITGEVGTGEYPAQLAKGLGQRVLASKDKLPVALFRAEDLLELEYRVFRP